MCGCGARARVQPCTLALAGSPLWQDTDKTFPRLLPDAPLAPGQPLPWELLWVPPQAGGTQTYARAQARVSSSGRGEPD